jgi:hypothetical protein
LGVLGFGIGSFEPSPLLEEVAQPSADFFGATRKANPRRCWPTGANMWMKNGKTFHPH